MDGDPVLTNLNKVIIDHLEQAGFSKISKLLKEEMSKQAVGERPRPGIQSAKARKEQPS